MSEPNQTERVASARLALEGLSVGDAFGELFFAYPQGEALLAGRALPDGPWRYTDDTVMGHAVVAVLERCGRIDQDQLAVEFARRYLAEPDRGYGVKAHDILCAIAAGEDWRMVSKAAFDGAGSMGNGGAMRVAPVGAYFADDLDVAAEQARLSAQVTHAHPDGQAGAIAVAVAAAVVCHIDSTPSPNALFEAVLEHTPAGLTRDGIVRAAQLETDTDEARVLHAPADQSTMR